MTIRVKRIILGVESASVMPSSDMNRVKVLFSARALDMTDYKFYVTRRTEQDKKINVATGTVTEGGMQSVMYYSPEELVPATYADPVSVLLGRYTVHFIATINGQTHHTFANF